MQAESIWEKIRQHFPDAQLRFQPEIEPYILVEPEQFLELCSFLKTDAELQFDFLLLVTAIDWPDKLQAVYILASYQHNHRLTLKVNLPRDTAKIPSLCQLWSGANWHERETYDLFGIKFIDHPDLQRIMMPADWEGHPLRKDYQHPNLVRKPEDF